MTHSPSSRITREMLRRSKPACHRIEDELLRRVQPLRVTSRGLAPALEAERSAPPVWCEPAAWERILDAMLPWVAGFGDLRYWWELRHRTADGELANDVLE